VLDPARILTTSSSNFGAPPARGIALEGSVLSIDPNGDTIAVPADFAAADGQASTLHGRVQLFTARSLHFNSAHSLPRVGRPLGISINNAFGLLSFANAPFSSAVQGLVSVAGPEGKHLSHKVLAGPIANVMLGPTPDDPKQAVFAVLTADGAIMQVREGQEAEELAPAGTICGIGFAEIAVRLHDRTPSLPYADPKCPVRIGIIFRWFPDRTLFAADPVRNAVIALPLTTSGEGFRAATNRIYKLPEFDTPIDLAPADPEAASPAYASNTTLARGSDMYVANRGNGTIVRMREDGAVLAVRRVTLPGGQSLGPGRLNGIAVSPEATRIWLTAGGTLPGYPDAPGAILEIPAFGPAQANEQRSDAPASGGNSRASRMAARGARLFNMSFTPRQGLGPLYNAQSCSGCHQSPRSGGMGPGGFAAVQRIGRRDGSSFDPLIGHGGPIARKHAVAKLGSQCSLAAGAPALANVISTRNSPPLFGLGLIEAIPDETIRAGAVRHGPGAGRPNIVRDPEGRGRPGRFGWKADTASLEQFVAEAFRNELGMTNPLAPADLVPPQADCGNAASAAIKIDRAAVHAVVAFITSLPPPLPAAEKQDPIGRILFSAAGCTACHTPALIGPAGKASLYSDLLLHDMGPALDDGIVQGEARGQDWRTTPLWGLGKRRRFLHDGRARNVEDAIMTHDGEGRQAAAAFSQLTRWEQDALLTFLLGL
jgi:hypothetical protein